LADYQTLPDLRVSFREQIAELRQENNSLRGKLGNVVGKMGEYLFANTLRSRKRFKMSDFFEFATSSKQVGEEKATTNLAIAETKLNMQDVRTRLIIQRPDGKNMELDIVAESNDDHVLLVEVKKRQVKSSLTNVEDFAEKVAVYRALYPKQIVLAGFLSVGGFTDEARLFCEQSGIGWSGDLKYF
ncbi:hypothetical protein QUF64_06815, partial [Anaerolineales bacterium HSG6]|nr:hypothetical protein [Anaerolineales bacterium HSG6]